MQGLLLTGPTPSSFPVDQLLAFCILIYKFIFMVKLSSLNPCTFDKQGSSLKLIDKFKCIKQILPSSRTNVILKVEYSGVKCNKV